MSPVGSLWQVLRPRLYLARAALLPTNRILLGVPQWGGGGLIWAPFTWGKFRFNTAIYPHVAVRHPGGEWPLAELGLPMEHLSVV